MEFILGSTNDHNHPMLTWIVSNPYAYPLLEVAHIVGIALLLGNLVLLELRVWGLGASIDVRALARLALGVSLAGFGVVVLSGTLMFAGQPQELLSNRVFSIKIALVLLAGCNAGMFHARGGLTRLDSMARAQTILSLGLWIGVIICGRWIAYA
jgi:hypothetical protein